MAQQQEQKQLLLEDWKTITPTVTPAESNFALVSETLKPIEEPDFSSSHAFEKTDLGKAFLVTMEGQTKKHGQWRQQIIDITEKSKLAMQELVAPKRAAPQP